MRGLPYEVKSLVSKARDSALLAVETYNRPTASFRSGAYVVLMVIAWTSLFQAIFLRRCIKPYYRKHGSKRFLKVDGEYKRWELVECLRQHFQNDNPPMRKNLEFFIGLRNKIEHRTLPQLDNEIFGECQAMLLNFESLLCSEFGEKSAIRGGLSFALQFSQSAPKPPSTSTAQQEQRRFRLVKQFIDGFRSSLSTEVQNDLAYSFKVYLVPKIGAHASGDAIAVDFVKYDASRPEEMKQYEKVVALIKPKEIRVANLGLLRPTQVVSAVAGRLGRSFNHWHHGRCYLHFNARPAGNAKDRSTCDSRYCVYDAAHADYLYTDAWVEHLVKALSDTAVYDAIMARKTQPPTLALQAVGGAA